MRKPWVLTGILLLAVCLATLASRESGSEPMGPGREVDSPARHSEESGANAPDPLKGTIICLGGSGEQSELGAAPAEEVSEREPGTSAEGAAADDMLLERRGEAQHGEQGYTVIYEECTADSDVRCRHEGPLVDGKKEGVWRFYDGLGFLWQEQTFKGDLLHGRSTVWTPEGLALYTKEYRAGQLHGTTSMWHPNGQLFFEKDYRRGVLHGVTKAWTEQGSPEREVIYSDGKLEGRCVFYRGDGQVDAVKSGIYEAGSKVRDLP